MCTLIELYYNGSSKNSSEKTVKSIKCPRYLFYIYNKVKLCKLCMNEGVFITYLRQCSCVAMPEVNSQVSQHKSQF